MENGLHPPQTQDIRCANCRRKLASGIYTMLTIKCPRCRVFNVLSAPLHFLERAVSATPPERHGTPPLKD